MNLGKITNIVLGAIKSRKDKTNKITQLAMAINGTYVEDTTYVDDRILCAFGENEVEFSVQYSNISKIVEKINSLKSGGVVLFLTEKQASKFSILAGLTGVEFIDLSQKDVYDTYAPMIHADFGVDMAGIVFVVNFIIGELDNNTKFTYDGVEYTLLPTEEPDVPVPDIPLTPEEPTAPVFNCTNRNDKTVTVSTFQLGDNCVYTNSVLTPEMIFLTSEQYNNLLISATIANGADSSVTEEIISAYTTPVPVSVLTNPDFQVPQDAVYLIPFAELISMIPSSLESVTFTYNDTDYVYTIDKITTTEDPLV